MNKSLRDSINGNQQTNNTMIQTPFESSIQILGDRVMLRAIPRKSAIITLEKGADGKLQGDIYIVALGDGPNMATKFPKLKVGAKVSVKDMGFQPVVDEQEKVLYRIYAAEDIIAILPE